MKRLLVFGGFITLLFFMVPGCGGGGPTSPGNDTYRVLGINFEQPVGSLIAYSRIVDYGDDSNSELFIMFPNGLYPNQLTHNHGDDNFPAFSPDGQHIAYCSNDFDNSYWGSKEIFRFDTPGDITQLTFDSWQFESFGTDWGPGFIIASRLNTLIGAPFDVVNISAHEPWGNWETWVNTGHVASYNPAISRNGRWIAFSARPAGATYFGDMEIYILHKSWDTAYRLTYLGDDSDDFNDLIFSNNPTFSPNIRYIAFDTTYWGNSEIAVIDLLHWSEDYVPMRFTESESSDRQPCFSPDGKWIAWCSDRDGNFEIYKQLLSNPNNDPPVRLTFTDGDEANPDWALIY